MNKTRVFVSFDFDNDKSLKDLLIGQSKNPDSPFEVIDWSMKEAAPEKNWETEAENRIIRSEIILIILGVKTHQAPGVLKEISMAKKHDKKIVQIIGHNDQYCQFIKNIGNVYEWTWNNLKQILQ